jgi:hypothetical protein
MSPASCAADVAGPRDRADLHEDDDDQPGDDAERDHDERGQSVGHRAPSLHAYNGDDPPRRCA